MVSFNYSEIFNIGLNTIFYMFLLFISGVVLLKILIYIYIKYGYLIKDKKRITDKKYVKDLEIDKHEVNNYINGFNNKKRRKSDIDIKEF